MRSPRIGRTSHRPFNRFTRFFQPFPFVSSSLPCYYPQPSLDLVLPSSQVSSESELQHFAPLPHVSSTLAPAPLLFYLGVVADHTSVFTELVVQSRFTSPCSSAPASRAPPPPPPSTVPSVSSTAAQICYCRCFRCSRCKMF